MTARVMIVPGAMPSRDANGRNLPAKFRFYLGGSAGVPTVVYTDATLTVPHPFPLLSDSAGRWPPIWADDSLTFDVGWSDQVFDKSIGGPFTNISPAADAVLASVDMANSAAAAAEASDASAALHDASAAASALAAAAAAAGLKVVATSSTPNLIGAGSKTFGLQQVTDFALGMDVEAADFASPAVNRMVGTVTGIAGNNLTILVPGGGFIGSGTPSNWQIALTAIGGVVSIAGVTGILSAATAKAALAITPSDVAGLTGLIAAFAIAL